METRDRVEVDPYAMTTKRERRGVDVVARRRARDGGDGPALGGRGGVTRGEIDREGSRRGAIEKGVRLERSASSVDGERFDAVGARGSFTESEVTVVGGVCG
jgi:hypothetical protein